jgi:hypothetical protein
MYLFGLWAGVRSAFATLTEIIRNEFVKRDFENTDRALLSGGFILFDDSADGSKWEVNRLTREIASGHQYELVSRNPNYLFRKK